MKKYNCNNTLEYVHERSRMCDSHTHCIDCPICTNCRGKIRGVNADEIAAVQKWSDEHPETTLTDKQVEILKALNLLGLNFMAQDSDGEVYAYTERPSKERVEWVEDCELLHLNLKSKHLRAGVFDAISPLVNWSDTEPLCIAEALEQAEVRS